LFTKAGERGRQVSLSFATIAFMGVVGPILAGFIIAHAGYDALFGTAIALLAVATVSYAFVPETTTHFDWSIKETWQKLFSRDLRGVVVGEFANGAEVIVNLIVWPIFLYEVLGGDVFEIGAVSTIVVGATIVIQLVMGRYLDAKAGSKEHTLRVGSVLNALGWIFKIFVLSTAQIFFVGLYHNIVRIFVRTPFSALIYDMSGEQGEYVDEFTVIREMSAHAGRAACLVLVTILTLYVPIEWTFVIAAFASVALNLIYRLHRET
jgi:MFS family permease